MKNQCLINMATRENPDFYIYFLNRDSSINRLKLDLLTTNKRVWSLCLKPTDVRLEFKKKLPFPKHRFLPKDATNAEKTLYLLYK